MTKTISTAAIENSPAETLQAPEKSVLPAELQQSPKCKTKGEKLFDLGLYGGISYGIGFVLSVMGGHFFLKGRGRSFFNNTEKALHDGLENVVTPKYAKLLSRESMRIMALGAGGHAVMVPIKLLEDNKKRIVYWINSKFFPSEYSGITELKPASQMRDDELPALVETPTKMSWGKTAMRRMLVFFGIPLVLAPFSKANAALEKTAQRTLAESLSAAADATQSKTLTAMNNNKLVHEYIELSASDLYLSAIAAFMVRMTNGAHGIFKGRKKAPAPATAPDSMPAQPPAAAAVAPETLPNKTHHANNMKPTESYRRLRREEQYAADSPGAQMQL